MYATNASLFKWLLLQDEAPEVPLYATAYLKLSDEDDVTVDKSTTSELKIFRTCFTQPGALPDFINRVRRDKVIDFSITVVCVKLLILLIYI